MKTYISLICSAIAGFLIILPRAVEGAGDPPELLSYQSYLVDADGAPLGADGSGGSLPTNYDVVFRIFSASSGGDLLWAEQQTITIDNGYFSVLLGEGSQVGSDPRPALSEVFSGTTAHERFIGMDVRFVAGGEFTEILPRLRLLTSPYAFLSSQARAIVDPSGTRLVAADEGSLTVSGTVTATSFQGNVSADNVSGVLHPDRIPDLDESKLQAIIDLVYPVGSFYMQFPDANSNDLSIAFPAKFSPAQLFGGTWEEQWPNESVFFRTGGARSNEARSSGLQDYATKRLTGYTPWFQVDYNHRGGGRDGVFGKHENRGGGTDSGNSGDTTTRAFFDSNNQSLSSDTETRPRNRLIKVWKRVE